MDCVLFENFSSNISISTTCEDTTIKNCNFTSFEVCDCGKANIIGGTFNYIGINGGMIDISESTKVYSNERCPIKVGYGEAVVNVKGSVINDNQTLSETNDYSLWDYSCFYVESDSKINVYDSAKIESTKGSVLFALGNYGTLELKDKTERHISFSVCNPYEISRESVITGLSNYPDGFNYEDYFTLVPIEKPAIMELNEKTGDIDVLALDYIQQPNATDPSVEVNITDGTTFKWKKYEYTERRIEASEFLCYQTYDYNNDEVTDSSLIYDDTNKTFKGFYSFKYAFATDDYGMVQTWIASGSYSLNSDHENSVIQFSSYNGSIIKLRFTVGSNPITTDDIDVYCGTYDPVTGIYQSEEYYSSQNLELEFKNKMDCTVEVIEDIPMYSYDWFSTDPDELADFELNNYFPCDYYFIEQVVTSEYIDGKTTTSLGDVDYEEYYACEATLNGKAYLSDIFYYIPPVEYTSEVEISIGDIYYLSTLEDINIDITTGDDLIIRNSGLYYSDGQDVTKKEMVDDTGDYYIELTIIGNEKPYYFVNQTLGDQPTYANGLSISSSLTTETVNKGIKYYNKRTGEVTDGTSANENVYLYVKVSFTLTGYSVTYDDDTDDAVTNMPIDEKTYFSSMSVPVSKQIPVRDGYIFKGWGLYIYNWLYQVPSDIRNPVFLDYTTMGEDDLVLYAIWQKEYTATDSESASDLETSIDHDTLGSGIYKLTKDTTIGYVDTEDSSDIVIDLNGYTLTMTDCMRVNLSKVTIYDSSISQTGKVVSDFSDWEDSAMFALVNSEIYLLGGTFYSDVAIMIVSYEMDRAIVVIDGADVVASGKVVWVISNIDMGEFNVYVDNSTITSCDSAFENIDYWGVQMFSLINYNDTNYSHQGLYIGENATITNNAYYPIVFLERYSCVIKGKLESTFVDDEYDPDDGCVVLSYSNPISSLYLFPSAEIKSKTNPCISILGNYSFIDIQGKLTKTQDKITIYTQVGIDCNDDIFIINNFDKYNSGEDYNDYFALDCTDAPCFLCKDEEDDAIYARLFQFITQPTEEEKEAIASNDDATYQWEKLKIGEKLLTDDVIVIDYSFDSDYSYVELPHDKDKHTYGGDDSYREFGLTIQGKYNYLQIWAVTPTYKLYNYNEVAFYADKPAQFKVKVNGTYIDDTNSLIGSIYYGTYDKVTGLWTLDYEEWEDYGVTYSDYAVAIDFTDYCDIEIAFVEDVLLYTEYDVCFYNFTPWDESVMSFEYYFIASTWITDKVLEGETSTVLSTSEPGLYVCKATYKDLVITSEYLDLRIDLTKDFEKQGYDYTGLQIEYIINNGLDGFTVEYSSNEGEDWYQGAPIEPSVYYVKITRMGDALYKDCNFVLEDGLIIYVLVCYDANTTDYYTGDLPATESIIPYSKYEISKNVLSREGYVFIGWSSEKYINIGQSIVDVYDITLTLYAQWQKIVECDGVVFNGILDESFTGGELYSGSYYLATDITLEDFIYIADYSSVNLYLNDKVLDLNHYCIINEGVLAIYDHGSTVRYFTDDYAIRDSYDTDGCYETYIDNTIDTPYALAITGGVITNGWGNEPTYLQESYGGAVYNTGSLAIYKGNFVGNIANGGTIANNGTFVMNGGRIVGNSGLDFGYIDYSNPYSSYRVGTGGVYNTLLFVMNGGEISFNTGNNGGAIFNDLNGSVVITDGAISYNEVYRFIEDSAVGSLGGAIANLGSLTINGGFISYNYSKDFGGAIYTCNSTTINGGFITNNYTDEYGGAIYVANGGLYVNGGTISYNHAVYGGAIYNHSNLFINGGTIEYNSAYYGGAVYNDYAITVINNGNISYNEGSLGGAIFNNDNSLLEINSGTISNNSAKLSGGAILNISKLTINNGTISGNYAEESGGAIFNDNEGLIIIYNGTISDNESAECGGGICNYYGKTTIYYCVISDNYSDNIGGGIFSRSTLNIIDGVISGNSAGSGGGIYAEEYLEILGGSIVENIAYKYAGIYAVNGYFYLVGGTITDNTTMESQYCEYDYAGVYVENCQFYIGGKLVIKNNTTDECENNLVSYSTISIMEDYFPLEEGSYIGISGVNPGDSFIENITIGSSVEYFHSDNPLYYIDKYKYQDEPELYLFYMDWKWSIQYDDNDATSGKVPTDKNGYFVDDEVTLASNTGELAKTGYRFIGWALSNDAVEALESYTVLDEDSVDMVITLYAVWAKEYAITYTLNGGTNDEDNPLTYIESETVTLQEPTRDGYKFAGWYLTEDFSGNPVEAIESGSTENKNLFANWQEKYNVTIVEDAQTATYSTETHSFLLKGTDKSIGEFTIEYFVNNDWTQNAPINAGSYNVRISRLEDDDYKAYTKTITSGLVIDKAQPTITVDTTPIVLTYGEQIIIPIATCSSGIVNVDKVESDLINVGTYTITYSVEESDNYSSANATVSVTINPQKVSEPTVIGSYKYNGNAQTVVLSGVESYMSTADSLTKTEVGTYTLTFVLDSNYAWAEGSDGKITWEIKAISIAPKQEDAEKKVDVSVTHKDGFDSDIEVTVDVTAETDVAKASEEKTLMVDYYNLEEKEVRLAKNEKVGVVYNVKLVKTIDGTSTEVQPSDVNEDSEIKVRMLIPDTIDVTKLTRIIQVSKDEIIKGIDFDLAKLDADGYYEITINQLGEFAFVYKLDATNEPDTNVDSTDCHNHWYLLIASLLIIAFIITSALSQRMMRKWRRIYDAFSTLFTIALVIASYFLMGCSVTCFAIFIVNAVLAFAEHVIVICFTIDDIKKSNLAKTDKTKDN